jgi:hypothetical protein
MSCENGNSSCKERLAAYTDRVCGVLRETLGDALTGVYLHGSAVLGGFDPRRSDIDILAVSARPLTIPERHAVARALSHARLPCPAAGLEFGLVTESSAKTLTPAPLFEVDMSSGPERDDQVAFGSAGEGGTDYVMHFASCSDHGVVLHGTDPASMFVRIPRSYLLGAFHGELGWALEHAPLEYQVLNACRAWRYLDEGVLCSKIDGGQWARRRVQDPQIIDAALARQRLTSDAPLDQAVAGAFVRRVRDLLAGRVSSADAPLGLRRVQ